MNAMFPCLKRGSWKSCAAWRPSTGCNPSSFNRAARSWAGRCRGVCVCNAACRRRRAADACRKIAARERQAARRDHVGAKREGRADDRHEKGFPEDPFDRGQAVGCCGLDWIVFHTDSAAGARTMPIKDDSWFVHFGKIAGIGHNRSLGQKLSITPQTLGLCLVAADPARKPVYEKNAVLWRASTRISRIHTN